MVLSFYPSGRQNQYKVDSNQELVALGKYYYNTAVIKNYCSDLPKSIS